MKKVLAAALTIAAVICTVLFLNRGSPDLGPTEQALAVSSPPSSPDPKLRDNGASSNPLSESEATTPAEEPDDAEAPSCLNFRPDLSHPWLAAEMARLEPLAPQGPGMAVYRGLSESDLRSLAAQKDSGAMTILGKRAELRAQGRPEDDAVGQLDGQDGGTRSWTKNEPLEGDVRAALVEAEHWYYQAVLHGRLFAMFHVGVLRERLYGGPVELGWIDEETYAEMDSRQRSNYYPTMVYGAAATTLAPEAVQSPMLTLALEGLGTIAGDPATVELVVNELRTDLQQNGLSLPDIPAYEGPGIDEWRR
nr:hypothetical protein [Woeseiaceae bacterium]